MTSNFEYEKEGHFFQIPLSMGGWKEGKLCFEFFYSSPISKCRVGGELDEEVVGKKKTVFFLTPLLFPKYGGEVKG